MNWPDKIPRFYIANVHNIPDGDYEITENGKVKRSSMGWLKYLFLDLNNFGPLDTQVLDQAEKVFRKVAQIPKNTSIEEWNDKQTRKRIANVLNQTMQALGY